MLNRLFSLGAIVMHLGVTNCYYGNLISGSILNQSFSSGASNINASWGPGVTHCFWGKLIIGKLIVQRRR